MTPAANGSFLNGVTRQRVLKLLREDGKDAREATLSFQDFDEADEIFVIGNFGKAELSMISYVEKNSAKCGIPPQVAEQLRAGHKGTENMEKKVCAFAEQAKTRGPAGPSLSEVLGSAAALPEATVAKKNGNTFDTLSGNALTR